MSIYLIRHGETPSNAARIVQTPDTPLSERGIAQAGRLSQRLGDAGIRRILSSDLPRAAMTAGALEQTTAATLELEPLLQERNFGALRGRPYSEPDVGPNVFAEDFEPPGGESWEIFHARVDRAWKRVVEAAGDSEGPLAVVTHGLVCQSVVSRLVELPASLVSTGDPDVRLRFGNTSLTVLEGPDPWRVLLLACTAHLDNEAQEEGAPV